MSPQDASKFTILPATIADAEALLDCIDISFADDLFRQAAMPKSREHLTPTVELRAWRLRNLRNRLSAPDKVLLKTVLTAQPNRMIGFADLQKPPPLQDEARQSAAPTTQAGLEAAQADSTAENASSHALPAWFDPELNDEMNDHLESWQSKIWGDDEQYWSLEKLGVDPAFRRQGMAKLLLKECLALADGDGLPMYLEALPGSARMYLKYGFQEQGSFEMLDGKYLVTLMSRQAQRPVD
ncbi:hypothetical protein B0A48_14512 [Cryoendolithus antarcticus]|uniref:N-acetyltransferase domain-containing protein n=1 Tax=Cryoendolithus antarcticus TaxID=1507870 RepID=A0A1V8SKS8_9PEZI|nr:hypothetical protein B0A48_14512 [Cryoendolithus antarcticus]